MYYPDLSERFKTIVEELKGSKVLVQGHVRPDGDCIGSQVALCRMLNQLGVDAFAANADTVPQTLTSFIGGDTPFYTLAELPEHDYTAVNVDCADPVRVGKVLHERHVNVFANVDHHISNKGYAKHNFIHADSSATGEILAGIYFDNGWEIDPVTAQALYIGIATDTGQFRFQSTTHQVFRICCDLVECGADPAAAALELYERESKSKLSLLQRFLASFEYMCNDRVCIGFLPDGIYEETGALSEDSEGLVDYARAIDGVEIGVLVEEREGKIKGSFRANDPKHRVDRLAKRLNGGGHACAAGFNLDGTLGDFYNELSEMLMEHFAKIDSE